MGECMTRQQALNNLKKATGAFLNNRDVVESWQDHQQLIVSVQIIVEALTKLDTYEAKEARRLKKKQRKEIDESEGKLE